MVGVFGVSERGIGLPGTPRGIATSSRNVRGARALVTNSSGAHQTHPWRRSLGCALFENYEDCDGDQQLGDEQEGAVIRIAGYGDVTVLSVPETDGAAFGSRGYAVELLALR